MTIYNMIKKHDKPLEDFENDENSILLLLFNLTRFLKNIQNH
jgi:hypothetical protein